MGDVFGVQIPPAIQTLMDRVQRITGQSVQFIKTQQDGFVEASSIENQTPMIWLRDPSGIALYAIAHGLLHLDCETSGFPRTRTLSRSHHKNMLLSELNSLVEHQVIFPKLHQLGFSPEQEMVTLFQTNFIPRLSDLVPFASRLPRTRQLFLAVRYAQLRLETPNGDVRATVETWYQNQAGQERQAGQQLESIIRSADVDNPTQYQTALVACIHSLGCTELELQYQVFVPFPHPSSRVENHQTESL
mgnify:FL=1